MNSPWRFVTAALLFAAAAGAVARGANASIVGRMGGVFTALIIAFVALGALREERWAHGAAFLLAICWFWATIALRVQGVIDGGETFIWLLWSIVVIVASVQGRPIEEGPRFPPLERGVGEDERDG